MVGWRRALTGSNRLRSVARPMAAPQSLTDRPTVSRFAFEAVAAFVAGWIVYQFSCWLVAPPEQYKLGLFAVDWQKMSVDPLSFPGALAHRILVPFLAWAFGYGGEGYVDFTRGLHVLMLASVYFCSLRLRARYLDALLVTVAIGITAPVQMYKLHWIGYTDPICYTLFLWMMVAARSPYVFWSLFLLNMMNHELAGFFLPWLWFLRRQEDRRWLLDGALLGAVVAIYGAYYFWVKSTAHQTYSVDYFLSYPLFPGGTFAVWNLAALHVIHTFGPLLAVLAWHQCGKSVGRERWHLWLVVLGIAVIFCIAFDWARHSNLILLPLVIASVRFLSGGNRNRLIFVALLGLAVLLFWLLPPWSPTAWPTRDLFNGPESWRAEHPGKHFLAETGVLLPVPNGIGFGPLSASVGNWLPVVWPYLAVAYAVGVTIWLTGWAYARRVRTEPGSTSPLS